MDYEYPREKDPRRICNRPITDWKEVGLKHQSAAAKTENYGNRGERNLCTGCRRGHFKATADESMCTACPAGQHQNTDAISVLPFSSAVGGDLRTELHGLGAGRPRVPLGRLGGRAAE